MGIIYRSLLGNALNNSVKCKVCHKITNYFKPVLLNDIKVLTLGGTKNFRVCFGKAYFKILVTSFPLYVKQFDTFQMCVSIAL